MSGAGSRRKGAQWERDVAAMLRGYGWEAMTSRAGRGGTQAGEDIITDMPLSVEAKNQKSIDLASWLDQAIAQSQGEPAVVFIKRRQKPAEHGYALMRIDQLLELVRRKDM